MMYFLELTDLDIHIIHMSILFYIVEFTTLDLDLDMLGLQNVIHVKSPHLSGCVTIFNHKPDPPKWEVKSPNFLRIS